MKRIDFQNNIGTGYLHCTPQEYHLLVAKLLQLGYSLTAKGD